MKKILCLMLVLVLSFGIVSCKKDKGDDNTDNNGGEDEETTTAPKPQKAPPVLVTEKATTAADDNPGTEETKDEKGCGATVGVASVAMIAISALGMCNISFRRKEND